MWELFFKTNKTKERKKERKKVVEEILWNNQSWLCKHPQGDAKISIVVGGDYDNNLIQQQMKVEKFPVKLKLQLLVPCVYSIQL